MNMQTDARRLVGLDVARYLAFAGMVFVNFRLAMEVQTAQARWLDKMFWLIEGKASATFVVLAGIGLSLATRSMEKSKACMWTARRALFLLVVGYCNLSIFPADILHYYAVYFLLALPFLHSRPRTLSAAILVVAAISIWAQVNLDYNNGWNWDRLEYSGLWTLPGALRHLFFNGFHPVLPWLIFLLFGLLLGQAPLHTSRMQMVMAIVGLGVACCGLAIADLLRDLPVAWLLGTAPLPAGPIYCVVGLGSASAVIGACLWLTPRLPYLGWAADAGKMTLTLYLMHIFIGMGTLEALALLDGSADLIQVALCASLFLFAVTLAASIWATRWAHGPVEAMMRRITAILPRKKSS